MCVNHGYIRFAIGCRCVIVLKDMETYLRTCFPKLVLDLVELQPCVLGIQCTLLGRHIYISHQNIKYVFSCHQPNCTAKFTGGMIRSMHNFGTRLVFLRFTYRFALFSSIPICQATVDLYKFTCVETIYGF
jgi:hypothetical protein